MFKELSKNYEHKEQQELCQQKWQAQKIYNWDETETRENSFVIDTPPPTVSGILHMGHVFSYTQTDFIARFQRMKGKTVFYPIGFDDNGLPTERLVEKTKKIRAIELPRNEFIKLCQEVVQESEEEFRKLFKSIGLSVDWRQEFQTISEQSRKISQMSFMDLLGKDKLYRQIQPCLWDPVDRTAIAQAEVEDIESETNMNYIDFDLENGKKLVIATTRPELLPACVAVFCHPDDVRYKKLIGTFAITPLFKVKVPIIADEAVAIEKGSGAVMCCTFGDQTDVDWWKKYKLPLRMILSKEGRLTNMESLGLVGWESVDLQLAKKNIATLDGLYIKKAREAALELLQNAGALKKQEKIIHSVKCAERSKAPLEILVSPQWFIKVLNIKEQLIEKTQECNWNPGYMKHRLEAWIEGLKWDWCISRQRFFGVAFPVWYSKRSGEEGKILLAHQEDLPVDPQFDLPRGYSRDEVEPELDVMDTWATSAVSPQLHSMAITKEFAIDYERHKKLYPADLRPQAHEIIRTWCFGTMVKSLLHENTIPWKNLMISGWVLAADKTKMSKSKGNIVTPVHLIEEKGTDVVRFWASNSRLGADITYNEEIFKLGGKFVNKLWNASKFCAFHFTKTKGAPTNPQADIVAKIIYHPVDLWILSRLGQVVQTATAEFEKFEYYFARVAADDFFWKDFCDNYLEIIKVRVYNETGKYDAGQQSAIYTIYHCLKTLLKIYAPLMPYITETLYEAFFEDQSIHRRGNWPLQSEFAVDRASLVDGGNLVQILDEVRKLKADRQVSIKAPIDVLEIRAGEEFITSLSPEMLRDLANVINAESIVTKIDKKSVTAKVHASFKEAII